MYLGETHTTLIGLIDRIRMLDNDIIRLQQKLDTAIEMKSRTMKRTPREQKSWEMMVNAGKTKGELIFSPVLWFWSASVGVWV